MLVLYLGSEVLQAVTGTAGLAELTHIAGGAVGVLLVFGTVTVSFAVRESRRRRSRAEHAPETEPAEEEEQELPLSREDILAMADSVSRSRDGFAGTN